ncbi:hypothetical protein MW887_002959 [Aspergillus wentii]|nr:hypothetical protein MW887_002959 [Aspergillus wentii]
MVASGPEASIINYSSRFTLTGMSGSFSSHLMNGINSVVDSNALPIGEEHEREELRKRQNVGAYTIPYSLQTGPTKYAPMAKQPGSTIPAKSPTPQYPTSHYSIATTYLPEATVQQTLSAAATYSVSSVENTASPAPHPHDKNN